MTFFLHLPRHIITGLIALYQVTLSPDHSWLRHAFPRGYCKFQPTCSDYVKQAVLRHGVIRGGWMGVKRVARCNPWGKGGVDFP